MKTEKEVIDKKLPIYIESLQSPEKLKASMIYSLEAGGKRVRPLLLLATLHGFSKPLEIGYDVASALEMVHTYSLIHDDLPSMDDDDLRRGKPTNHIIYGEAMATLAGDALLTKSFQLISCSEHLTSERKVDLIQRISRAIGPEGMVGGQVADMEAEGKSLQAEDLQQIHERKTGDLLAVAVEAGAMIAEADVEDVQLLRQFAQHVGLAFQIKDDILDIEGDEEELGKPVGSDEDNDKNTYPKLLGLDGAKEKLEYHLTEAKKCLYQTSTNHTLLKELADYIGSRVN
ncbi:polyprenyl synthetase family protein [Bacillus shivajii]|nr:farnesyl diphosphate synthase [Bacillus shivajii]UCZ55271.1 polyprenyl synthetase family protein [Bacillus shivajii]